MLWHSCCFGTKAVLIVPNSPFLLICDKGKMWTHVSSPQLYYASHLLMFIKLRQHRAAQSNELLLSHTVSEGLESRSSLAGHLSHWQSLVRLQPRCLLGLKSSEGLRGLKDTFLRCSLITLGRPEAAIHCWPEASIPLHMSTYQGCSWHGSRLPPQGSHRREQKHLRQIHSVCHNSLRSDMPLPLPYSTVTQASATREENTPRVLAPAWRLAARTINVLKNYFYQSLKPKTWKLE